MIDVKNIQNINWFCRLGKFSQVDGTLALSGLEPWNNDYSNEEDSRIANVMDWLPSSRDQKDPFWGDLLKLKSKELDKEREARIFSLESYKAVLLSLRKISREEKLECGPHDFLDAAKGSALYAYRQAAYESVLEVESKWNRILNLYEIGHWPCGITKAGFLVVY